MVVLSLVLGLSEQDDFANIPDLQNPGTQQNQNAQGDKRCEHRRGPAAAATTEMEAQRGRLPRPARLLDEAVAPSVDAGVGGWPLPQPVPSHMATLVASLGSEASAAVLGPFWIKPAPWACLPLPGASQPLCPIFPLGSPLLPPHLPSLPSPDPEIPVFLVVGGWGGDAWSGAPACCPSSSPPQPPLGLELPLE